MCRDAAAAAEREQTPKCGRGNSQQQETGRESLVCVRDWSHQELSPYCHPPPQEPEACELKEWKSMGWRVGPQALRLSLKQTAKIFSMASHLPSLTSSTDLSRYTPRPCPDHFHKSSSTDAWRYLHLILALLKTLGISTCSCNTSPLIMVVCTAVFQSVQPVLLAILMLLTYYISLTPLITTLPALVIPLPRSIHSWPAAAINRLSATFGSINFSSFMRAPRAAGSPREREQGSHQPAAAARGSDRAI